MTNDVLKSPGISYSYVFLFINLVIFIDTITIFLNPLRLLDYLNVAYISVFLSYIIGFIITILSIKKMYIFRISIPEMFIIIIPFLLLPISLINHNPLQYTIADIIKPIIFIGVISYFRNEKIPFLKILNPPKSTTRLIYFMFFLGCISTAFTAYIYFSHGKIHMSSSDLVYSITTFYFLLKGHYLFFIISLIVLIVGGKIGAFLGILFALIIFFLLKYPLKTIILIASLIIFFSFSYSKLNYLNKIPMVSKIDYISKSNSSFDLTNLDFYVFGGRYTEIQDSLYFLEDNWYFIFTGGGPGHTYKFKSFHVVEDVKHNVHFSPISLLTTYGLFFTIIFYLYIFINFIKCFQIIKSPNSFWFLHLMALYFIANFINSFTSYAFFMILIFSIAIGIINNKHIRKDLENGTLYCS